MEVDVWRLVATAVFVFLNGFFVAAEFALVKARFPRIKALADGGSSAAGICLKIMAKMDMYLSACQLGITIASLVLGWLAEPAVAKLIISAAEAAGLEVDPDIVHWVALITALVIITILHMTVGEQAPKIWAIRRSEQMLLKVARPLYYYTFILRPLIIFINFVSNLLLRIVGLRGDGHGDPPPDSSEISGLLAQSAAAGHITGRQLSFANNVLEMVKLEARHILVPRDEVVCVLAQNSTQENVEIMARAGHSRFPLCEGDLDDVIGVVHVKSVFMGGKGGEVDLQEAAKAPVFVPERQPISKMIRLLQESGSGLAVVVDDHGNNIGLAFLEDALEEIVGPIRDEFDEAGKALVQKTEEGCFEILGRTPLPEAAQHLGLVLDGEEDTFGGYIMARLGRIPKVGDELVLLDGYTARVVSVSRRVPSEILVEKKEEPKDA